MKRILFAFLALIAANFLSAQASLDIVLLDQNKKEIPFQGIQVSNTAIGYQKQVATNENGKVQLYGLSTSGKYSIEVLESAFYHPLTQENIVLISGKATSVTLTLTEKTQALDVATVSGDNYVSINAVNAEVASSLDAREINTLPVEGRDITRVLYRLPNITQATGFYPEAPNIAINGANSLYTNYQIDGMDNNENFLGGQRFAMPIGFTQSITALTNNFSAEHGLSSNGIINITTKSGTNETAGEVFYMTRPGAVIDSPSEFALRDLSGNQVKDGFQRHQVGFGLGGAITQNKTFYYLNVEHTLDIKDNLLNVPQLGINETVQGRNTFTYLSGKLDHNWGERFQTSLRVNTGLSNIERQGGGLEGGVNFPSAGNTQARNAMNIALKNTVRRTNFIYEGNFLYGRFRWNYATPEDEGSPNVTVLDPQGLTMAVLGHPGYVFDVTENTQVIQQKLTFLRDKHTIKAGAQYKRSNFALFGGGNPNGSYTVQLNEDQLAALQTNNPGIGLVPQDLPGDVSVLNYGVELRPNAFEANQNIFSIYIEDQWAIAPRLNANIGLRYDYDDLSKGGNDTGDLNNIAPRLSLNYTINEQSSVRLGYGMYYDKILYALYSDALQFNSNSEGYKAQLQALIDQGVLPEGSNIEALTNEGNLTANDPNAAYLQGPLAADLQNQRNEVFQNELRILNPNGYDNPYSHQFMVGYQRKIDEELSFYVDVMHNRSFNLFRLRNLNAPAAYQIDPDNVVVQSQADADASRPVPIFTDEQGNYALINGDTLRNVSRNVVMTESEGRSNYYALNFTLQKERGDDNYAFRFMYTLSYLENNTEDINFRAMDGNDFEAEWGPSINDRTHLINSIFTYYPTKNLSLNLSALLQSGQPINRIPDAGIYGTTDLNGDGRAFGDAYVGNSDRSPGEERNSDRLPWSNTFDLSMFYTIPFGEQSKMEIGAYVFNIFNAENFSGYSNNATQSNQIQVGPASSGVFVQRNAAPPRQFQFSARFLF